MSLFYVYSVVGKSTGSCALVDYFALSADIIVEAESVAIVEAESALIVVVVVVSVVSVFFEQAVVRAIMAMKKKADFVIAFIVLTGYFV